MFEKEPIYAQQEYSVVIDVGDQIDLRISVMHTDTTQLTEEEIKAEARGYAEQAGIQYADSDIVEIVEIEKTLKN